MDVEESPMRDEAESTKWIQSLAELVAPLTADHFLREICGKTPIHMKGHPERFAYLLTWDSLNAMLSRDDFEGPKFEVVKGGKMVPPAEYRERIEYNGNYQAQRINLGKLNHLCREGASLVLKFLQRERHKPISHLCRILELALASDVHVTAIAGWHDTQGFSTHWDKVDVFVMQVEGKKHWRIFPPTQRYHDDPDQFTGAPQDNPYWEGDLNPGDFLYIPRGWWHDAHPSVGPVLHLSFIKMKSLTGLDLAKHVLNRLACYEPFRSDIPRYANTSEQEAYISMFRKTVNEAMDKLSLEGFLQEVDSKAPGISRPTLPWSAVPEHGPLPEIAWVHWLPTRMVGLKISDGKVTVDALGSTFSFDEAVGPILKDLMESRTVRLSELRAMHPGKVTDTFVIELTSLGLVAIAFDRDI